MKRVPSLSLGALWMRAVANACGYTPETAKPLGLAYAHVRFAEAELDDGNLYFGGLSFVELGDGLIVAGRSRFRPVTYDRRVVTGFETLADHQRLLYLAIDRAEQFPIERLDATPVAWQYFAKAAGGRRSVSLPEAHRIIGGRA